MELEKRITTFINLGKIINKYLSGDRNKYSSIIENAIDKTYINNKWFTTENIKKALEGIVVLLNENDIKKWVSSYPELKDKQNNRIIAVILAGNIPCVGFHDFLCVLITGNNFLGKLSEKDQFLLPALSEILIDIEPGFSGKINFTSELIKNFDAVIATGSNNSARYFDYYFGKYPNIIRKSRNSLAVLTGDESDEELDGIANDIFSYFGLGCRNISKTLVNESYDFTKLFAAIDKHKEVLAHNKYGNNYSYYRAIYLMNNEEFKDTGFLMLKQDESLWSPVGVLFYDYYKEISDANKYIESNIDNIQCIVSISDKIKNSIPPGTTQNPKLWDYADGVDTIKFLLRIK